MHLMLLSTLLASSGAPASEKPELVQVSKQAVESIYKDFPVDCDKEQSREQGIDAKRLDEDTVLLGVVCGLYSYNASTLYYTQTADQAPERLAFSLPAFRFHLEMRGDVEHTIIDSVDEMRPEGVLYNTHYDPSTKTLSSYNKHRGVGDAFTEASWKWESPAGFQLVTYAVDHSLDGKLTAAVVYPVPDSNPAE